MKDICKYRGILPAFYACYAPDASTLTISLLQEMLKNPNLIAVKNSSMPTQDIQIFKDAGIPARSADGFAVFNGPDDQFIMDAELRDAEAAAFEYHRRYADLQFVLSGSEHWGFTEEAESKGDFHFTEDCGFASGTENAGGILKEGYFVLFFPGELHKPGCRTPSCTRVRKAVIKILME